jgi:hypothetical protein
MSDKLPSQSTPPQRAWRKKPVVIEAVQFLGAKNMREVCDFIGGDNGQRYLARPPDELRILTLEGVHHGTVGDWVIRGVKGEFYFCKPDIFAATYEPASTPVSESTRRIDVLEEAARVVEKIGHDYMQEHGSYDASTNAWEIHHRHADRIEALDDAVDAIRKMQGTVVPSAGARTFAICRIIRTPNGISRSWRVRRASCAGCSISKPRSRF